MVLTAAFEFDPRSNKEATIRPTDNIEVPQVITDKKVGSRDEPQFKLNLLADLYLWVRKRSIELT